MPLNRQGWQTRNTVPARAFSPAIQRAEQEELLHRPAHNSDAQQLSPTAIQQLQRSIGNQATTRLVTQKSPSPTIQRNPIKERLTGFINDLTQTNDIQRLADHLLTAMNAIEAGDWETACDLLYSKDIASSLGHQLSVDMPTIDLTKDGSGQFEKAIRNARYSFANKTIRVVDVSPYNPQWLQLSEEEYNDAERQEKIRLYPHLLPVALEEWIHMFQNMTQSVLSEGTESFMMSPQVNDNQQLGEGNGRWNMNEVDIYATYKDLGWDHVLLAFKDRYPERIKYEEFTEVLRRGNVSRRGRRN